MAAEPRPDAVTISVIMPVFNASRTVVRAVDSALAQQGWALEIVIVDDCSTDDSLAVIAATYGGDPRIRVLSAGTNQGPAHARNLAISHARGDWIAILDADDAWLPGRLDAMMAVAQDADLVADDLVSYDAVAGVVTGQFFPGTIPAGPLSLTAFMKPSVRFDFGYLKPLIRKSFLADHSLAYRKDMRHGEDFMLYAHALCLGARFQLIAQGFYLYTTPVGQSSGAASPHSKTQYDDNRLCSAILALESTHGGHLSTAQRAAIRQRAGMMERQADGFAFMGRLKRRDLAGSLAIALRKPGVLPFAFQRMAARLWQRGTSR
jgi:succinoglycan biosynthesis protein ExoO